jgi:hypothetical protein
MNQEPVTRLVDTKGAAELVPLELMQRTMISPGGVAGFEPRRLVPPTDRGWATRHMRQKGCGNRLEGLVDMRIIPPP